jgi:hypothetical protein
MNQYCGVNVWHMHELAMIFSILSFAACCSTYDVEKELWKYGYGSMAMEVWLWKYGYGSMAMEVWLWKHGYGSMAMEAWLWKHGYGSMAMEVWLWKYGYVNMFHLHLPAIIQHFHLQDIFLHSESRKWFRASKKWIII